MTVSFNLIEKPFIPCVHPDGQTVEWGLRDVLLKAHEIAELRDGSPLVTVALHRLLLAILHRCYQGPKNSAERVAIRKAGCFDADRITRYFEKWADRFDLFHETYPFYQRAGYSQGEPSSVNRLVKELSRGNNAVLFDHTTDDPPIALTPAQAARAVIAEQVFAYSAGRGRKGEPHTLDAPTSRAAAVFALGKTLFETLWLDLTVYNGDDKPIACDADDSPIWERTPVAPYQDSRTPRGYLDFLTWQSRTICLHPETDGDRTMIRRVSYSQGRVWKQIAGFYDPFAAYERIPDVGDRAIQLHENRDLWRDSAALFQFGETDQFRGPTCLHTLGSLVSQGDLSASDRYRVMVAGARVEPGQPNLIFWRHETLPLPLAYLNQPALVEALKKAIGLAEQVAEVLLTAVRKAVASALKPGKDETRLAKTERDVVKRAMQSLGAERLFWSRLEEPFRRCIQVLPSDDDAHRLKVVQQWFTETLELSAWEAYRRTAGELEDSSRALRAAVSGEAVLRRALARIAADLQIVRNTHQKESANAGT